VIIVLSGSQSDEHGRYSAGDVVLNPEGSEHEVWSVDGCTILIQWERPVTFVG
jgi:anti-sigma factor ChrR (cupin superfamily)